MATKAKRRQASPIFITKSELAYLMGPVDTGTIDEWVNSGTFPPPHSRPGERTAVWKREHFQSYVDTGRWPEAAFRNPGEE